MPIERDLRDRPDVDNADIPRIIERAQELQDAAQRDEGVSVDEIKAVARELQIDDVYVEAALAELEDEQAAARVPAPVESELGQGQPMDRGFIVGAVVGILALFAIPALIQRPAVDEEASPSRHSTGVLWRGRTRSLPCDGFLLALAAAVSRFRRYCSTMSCK